MRILMIMTFVVTSAFCADTSLSDDEILKMAKRRMANNDFGFSAEQMRARSISSSNKLYDEKNIDIKIMKRAEMTSEGKFTIRFKITIGKSHSLNEQLLPSMIVDAFYHKDVFGTWNMTWAYNVDQTYALDDEKQQILKKLGKDGIDIGFLNSLPDILKRKIFPAQVIFQGGNYEDLNNNGIGDFAGDLEILCGQRQTKKGEELKLIDKSLLRDWANSAVEYKLFCENERGFYVFMKNSLNGEIYMLSASGTVKTLTTRDIPKSLEDAKKAQ